MPVKTTPVHSLFCGGGAKLVEVDLPPHPAMQIKSVPVIKIQLQAVFIVASFEKALKTVINSGIRLIPF